jgi:hypothetical protein
LGFLEILIDFSMYDFSMYNTQGALIYSRKSRRQASAAGFLRFRHSVLLAALTSLPFSQGHAQ